jgi:predicted esterase
MKRLLPVLMGFALLLLSSTEGEARAEELVYRTKPMKLSGEFCKPEGAGPFPAVVFNHGGLRNIIGGDPEGTCRALAEAGFVGFSPIRRKNPKMKNQIKDVMASVDTIKALSVVQPDKIALVGFSRGALLSLIVANRRPDFKALVIMGVAPGHGHLEREMDDLSGISAPVLLLVAENDTGSKSTQDNDTVALTRSLEAAFKNANLEANLIVYPTYPGDGHQLFSEIGTYWKDVIVFLKRHLI